jgi:putative transposase
LDQLRGIATRYDKYALTYLGGVILVAAIITHRLQLADTP